MGVPRCRLVVGVQPARRIPLQIAQGEWDEEKGMAEKKANGLGGMAGEKGRVSLCYSK